MAGEKKIENAEPVAAVLNSDAVTGLVNQEMASGKEGVSSDLTSKTTKDVVSGKKGENNQAPVGEHGATYQPSSGYNYYYPGYNGSFAPVDDHAYFHANGSNTGLQSDNGSMYYYFPGYGPYASGDVMGVDGQGIGQQQYISSSGYHQPPVYYGSEALPCYSWDPTFVRDIPKGVNGCFQNAKPGLRSSGLAKSNALNSTKTNGGIASKFSKPLLQSQPVKSLNKVPHLGSDFATGVLKGYTPQAGRLLSFGYPKQGLFQPSGFQTYNKSYGRVWNGSDRFRPKDRDARNGDFEASAELTRGPRSRSKAHLDSPTEKKEELGVLTACRDQYNLPEFQTDYENAKFYVIKSYSEDDIHKSIKYDVWASTPNGNKKLDAAFRDEAAKSSETGTKCPIFLFFSVNGSGQFVGVAEMIGQVDFNKDMDFWQVDKWNGFFPVRWHVVKDIPNAQLRHIILENNENKPVTFTRDTQEVGLKQGVEMLNIFKSYTEKTSLFDDFSFYENREKALRAKRSLKPATLKMESIYNNDFTKLDRKVEGVKTDCVGSLIGLTSNLSLNNGA